MPGEPHTTGDPGGLLRRHRHRVGLDQSALAERAGVSLRTLRDIEHGRVGRPRDTSLRRIITALPITDLDRAALHDAFTGHGNGAAARERPGLRLGVLGPLLVSGPQGPVAVDQAMPRTLLSLLALHPGRPVPVSAAIDTLWGDEPPKSCHNLVQVYVGRLRRLLDGQPAPAGPDAAPGRRSASRPSGDGTSIRYSSAGYLLDPAVTHTDVADFAARYDQAAAALSAGDPDTAAARYLDALRCWRGPVLGGDDPRLRHHPSAVRLNRRRVEAATAHADLALAADRPAETLDHLRELALLEPLHEGLHARLIRALAAAGEQAAALHAFTELRERLLEQLGVSPGPQLTDAYQYVLAAPALDPALAPSRAVPAAGAPVQQIGAVPAAGASVPQAGAVPAAGASMPRARAVPAGVPAQLPVGVPAFTGRADALRRLDQALGPAGAGVPIVAVTGPGGVGKTALAVHWARRAGAGFPDGQLYVDLRGFDRSAEVVDPADAIRGFLDALGIEPHRVPRDPHAQTALYRSLTAGRRLLVVLDNARDTEQVAPLLAAGPGVCTIVTSRDRLTGLVAEFGAVPVALDLPDEAEAVELLTRRIGGPPADAGAAAAIVAACGRLPLALALVAARALQTGFPLAKLAAELRQPGASTLAGVRTVFSWSYRPLSPAAARMFRLLGIAPGADIAPPAAAALAGVALPDARRALRELADASLLVEQVTGRCQLHDLLRGYAGQLAAGTDTDVERRAALRRLLDHYTHTAYRAERTLNPSRPPIRMPVQAPAGQPARLDDAAARRWLGAERSVLLAALRQARDEGLDRHAWQLGWALDTFLHEQRRWQDEGAAWAVALNAATALTDGPAAAHAHLFLAVVAGRLDRFGEAHDHVRRSVELSRAAGDRPGEAENLFVLSYVCWLQGDAERALQLVRDSLELWAGLDDPAWEGRASNSVGLYLTVRGEHEQALAYYERALALHQLAGDRAGEVVARDNLGMARHELGSHRQAVAHFHEGLRLARASADRAMQAQLTDHLGDVCEAMGDDVAAREHWRAAYEMLADIGHPQAADISRKVGSAAVR